MMSRLADELRLDVRYAIRSLLRAPGFTAVVLLLLALGIGVNTAMFSLLDAVLWRMLPVREPEQLVFLERHNAAFNLPFKKFCDISHPLMLALRDRDPLLEETTTLSSAGLAATIDGQPEPVGMMYVAENFYGVLGVGAAAGRLIQPGDASRPPVVVLSHGFWQRRFGGRDVIGTSLTLGNTAHTIVGIAAAGFFGLSPGSDFDLSAAMPPSLLPAAQGAVSDPRVRPLWMVIGRVRHGASVDDVSRSLTALLRQMMLDERIQGITASNVGGHRIEARSASQGIAALRQRVSKPLAALMTLVLLVLLITCADVANLQLARAAARQREVAIRLSIGVGRARLIRQLLTESVMLAIAGGLLGIVVAYWSLQALLAFIAGGEPLTLRVSLDGRTLAFTAAVSLATGLLFGLAPAWRASRADAASLAQRGTHRGRPASMPSRLLVVAQVTLSTVLLVGAGLFVKSFQNLVRLDAGFDRTSVLAVAVDPQLAGIRGARVASLYRQTLERAAQLPGVRAVSFERNRPLGGGGSISDIRPAGYTPEVALSTWFEEVGPRYAETLGLRVLAGRDVRLEDAAETPKVILINATAARTFFPGQDPIGRRVGRGPRFDDYEVIGVVADVRHQSLREVPRLTVYLPALQDPNIRSTSILVRTTGDPLSLAPSVRQIVRDIEPAVPIMSVTTLDAVAARSLSAERLTATLATVFGVFALVLAGVGLSGVLLFGVTRRTREIGVRMALGATIGEIATAVVRESLAVVLIGLALGVPCALIAGHLAQTMLFSLSPSDPLTIGLAVATLATVSVLASIWPARRAAAVNPLIALRAE